MNNLVASIDQRRNFSVWLRTGRRPTRTADGIELKFNPCHDPRNGQFTFGPGGTTLPERSASSRRRAASASRQLSRGEWRNASAEQSAGAKDQGTIVNAVYRPDRDAGAFQNAQFETSREPLRSNSRAFEDPMTLEQTFPGLRDAPGGAVLSLLDNAFGFTAPANEEVAKTTQERSAYIISQIKALDPHWTFQSLGFPTTWEGQRNQLNELRMQRAAAFVKVKGDLRPMQVETMRAMQDLADQSYSKALRLYNAGALRGKLSKEQALGRFVDNDVRRGLRSICKDYQIKEVSNKVRVNRREYDSSQPESSYRIPDARVGDVAYDVTLSPKTSRSSQIRGFFNADFRPQLVVIIRPRQLGRGSSYIINRPEVGK
ncbi:MAG: hypothetical protein PGN12_04020 [Sphingomonas phyllosphaerae]